MFMKKIFTLLAAVMAAVGSMAADYTDSLTVTVNGVSSEQHATVSVTEDADGLMTFTLKNFTLVSAESEIAIGNIIIDKLTPVSTDNGTMLVCSRNINIAAGDDADADWFGPMLGEVPINMVARLSDGRAYASISIYMEGLGQDIDVTFGSGYQIPNSGFEEFHAYKDGKIYEPLRWHSFATAGGKFASAVNGTAHTFKSNDVRPGSAGSYSLSLKSTKVFSVVANGTVTTGRMNAGSMSATNVANHAELDMSNTELDGNGNPYYVDLIGHPDSLAVWVKFTQAQKLEAHPYATVSANITDGTYFQDPQDKTYNNIMAKAQNNTIATTDGAWKRIAIPFTYVDDNVKGKAILVTISTNADAGQGNNGDEIIIDDFELIYNAELASVSLDGDKVKTEVKGKGAFSVVAYGKDANGHDVATIDVYSEDLKTHSTHTFDITAAGIGSVKAANATRQVYSLGGQRVSSMKAGEVYIVKQNGKTYKVQK